MLYTICALLAAGILLGIDIKQRRTIAALKQAYHQAIQDGLDAFAAGEAKGRATTVEAAYLNGWDACASSLRMRHNAAVASGETIRLAALGE